jgi:hypothetical protein
MRFDNALCDGEPEAHPSSSARPVAVEHVREVVLRNAASRIGNGELHGPIVLHDTDCDSAARIRELDRVAQQIGEHLDNASVVA